MLPFFVIYPVLYLPYRYSHFWGDYCCLFIFGAGNLMTHATSKLNVMSCAKNIVDYSQFIPDLAVYTILLYLDHNKILSAHFIAIGYLFLVF